ncbi:hypothetical protein [Rhodococcus qingshengii]|uniref:hypothetical protein n=1 Tax=Rhodococcus qingshengii TaxID=334542 RepID=UPI0036DD19F7
MKRKRPSLKLPPKTAEQKFLSSKALPRKGLDSAGYWPDTGLLLFVGTDPSIPPLLRARYGGRLRITPKVENEIRGHSFANGTSDKELAIRDAATAAVREFLVGSDPLAKFTIKVEDLPLIDQVVNQLKALSSDPDKRHSGEAEIIAVAARVRDKSGKPQIMLGNDGDASLVAKQHGVYARHAADVLAEFACRDKSLEPSRCYALFSTSCAVTSPPKACWPPDEDAFVCIGDDGECRSCDPLQSTVPVSA